MNSSIPQSTNKANANEHSEESATHFGPELAYKYASDPKVRRQIQHDVVVAYRKKVSAYVSETSLVPARCLDEARHVGLIGLLDALARFDPSQGVSFWSFAKYYVRSEIQSWANVGVYWRRRSHNLPRDEKVDPDCAICECVGDIDHDTTASDKASVEDQVAIAEGIALIQHYVSMLNEKDSTLLLNGIGFGRGRTNSPRGKSYMSLVERARAFVIGNE